MLRQLKEIFEGEMATSYCSDKKLEKCLSATDLTSQNTKKFIKTPQLAESPELKSQRSRQTDEFLFCLKLKMIGITGIFGNSELETNKIQTKDPNEVLNLLTRKIKNFQKQSNKRINEEVNKNKLLQIKIIGLQSSIKTLQAEQTHLQKQIQKNSRTYSIDLKKNERKIQESEQQKQSLNIKLHSANQVSKEQSKFISQLEQKLTQFSKIRKSLETSVFQKQKQIAKHINNEKLTRVQHSQQCEGLKQSLMKKTEQINKLNSQIKSLKQVVDSKDRKNEEMRISNNKLFHQKEQFSQKLQAMTVEQNILLANVEKIKQEHRTKMQVFLEKQQSCEKATTQIEQSISSKMISLQKFRGEVEQARMNQEKMQKKVGELAEKYASLAESIEQSWTKRESLLREQFEIEKRFAILDMQKFYKHKFGKFQDEIVRLKCQQKNE